MAIASDFTVAVNGNIRHSSGATHYTVLELHRFLEALADDAAASGDDLIDITSATPSERSTDNIITLLGSYNIDDEAAEYFYGGSIKQGTGGTEVLYSGLKVLGAVNDTDTQLEVIQNNTFYDTVSPFWGTQATGGYNGDAASGVLMRVLVKSRTAGADIDGKRVRVQARHWGDTYDFFNVTLGEGEAVAAIGTTPDAQNDTLRATVAGYTHVVNTPEGYQTIDLDNGSGAQPYYSKWTYGADTSGDGVKGIWEFIKDLTGNGTIKTLYGLPGEMFLGITHEIALTPVSGIWDLDVPEQVTWATGTGQLLAINHATAPSKMWIQLLTGVAPTGGINITGVTSSAVATRGTVTTRTVPKIFLGSYTGTLIGAFGVGVKATDLTAADTIQDLLGVIQVPPNIVEFTLSGIVAGEDYILVGPKAVGNDFDFSQLTLNTTLSGATETAVVVTASIPDDTPASGSIRIQLDDGRYRRIAYTSWIGSTFTISSTNFTGANQATAPRDVMITYLDKLAASTSEVFSTIYDSPRNLYVRVRDGGASPIKTFESPATLTAAGGSAVASRITDA